MVQVRVYLQVLILSKNNFILRKRMDNIIHSNEETGQRSHGATRFATPAIHVEEEK